MGVRGKRRVFVLAGLLLLSACSNSDDSEAGEDTTTTTASVVETTVVPSTTEATSTTLSDRELAQAELEAAESEIEAAIQFWWTYPVDTSLADEGNALEVLADPMRQRLVDLAASRTAAGETQRSRGGDRIEVTDVRVDMEAGIADIDVCSSGDHELIDNATGEVIDADDGDSWEGRVDARLVDGVWLLENFFTDEKDGGNQCEFSN